MPACTPSCQHNTDSGRGHGGETGGGDYSRPERGRPRVRAARGVTGEVSQSASTRLLPALHYTALQCSSDTEEACPVADAIVYDMYHGYAQLLQSLRFF